LSASALVALNSIQCGQCGCILRPLPFGDAGGSGMDANCENYTHQPNSYFRPAGSRNQSFSDLAGWAGFYSAGR